jgi:hypothetical protein
MRIQDTSEMTDCAVYLSVFCGCGFRLEANGFSDIDAMRDAKRQLDKIAEQESGRDRCRCVSGFSR